MSRKLKIANLILIVIIFCCLFVYAIPIIFRGYIDAYIVLLLLAYQIFPFVYAIKDFFREGKTSGFIFSILPNFCLIILILFLSLTEISNLEDDVIKYILMAVIYLIFNIIIIINKANYWKKLKENKDSELIPTVISTMNSKEIKVANLVPALSATINMKLKIANLILTIILFLYCYWYFDIIFDAQNLFMLFNLLMIFQIFLLLYVIKDFFSEGKTFWFLFGIFPNICLLLFGLWGSLIKSFTLSIYDLSNGFMLTYRFLSIFLPVAVIMFYIKVVNNKINYWKKVKEIHE